MFLLVILAEESADLLDPLVDPFQGGGKSLVASAWSARARVCIMVT